MIRLETILLSSGILKHNTKFGSSSSLETFKTVLLAFTALFGCGLFRLAVVYVFVRETLEGRRRLTPTVRMSYFCVIRKEEEKKKRTLVKKTKKIWQSFQKKKTKQKNLKKEPVGFLFFVG